MLCLRVMLCLAAAACVLAQSPATTGNRAMDNAIRRMRPGFKPYFTPAAPLRMDARLTPEERPSPCSVPLTEMAIQDNVTYTMQVLKPHSPAKDRMPQVKVPAPPCPKK